MVVHANQLPAQQVMAVVAGSKSPGSSLMLSAAPGRLAGVERVQKEPPISASHAPPYLGHQIDLHSTRARAEAFGLPRTNRAALMRRSRGAREGHGGFNWLAQGRTRPWDWWARRGAATHKIMPMLLWLL